jgi:FtsP/CotA-like multicopper oxidase with cupredoxin domain
MKPRFCSALFIISLLFPAMATAQVCSGSNVIKDPAQLTWQAAGSGESAHFTATLQMREATNLKVGSDTITTRVYGEPGMPDSIPGPTMVMEPGNKYVLRFENMLPFEPKSTEHNVFKDPNVSNLHTHGLHISGESPGDDVTRSFEGGAVGDFVYDIPSNHMGGTFWYHAHHHGSTFLQVSGGAFGLIVIDDGNDGIPDNVAAMEERQLVVAYLDPDVAGTGGDTLISGTLSPTWTVNGKVSGDLCMPPDTWQHWRVLIADRDAKDKTVTIGSQCQMALMARDGVWRTEVPKELPTNSITLTGASRADLAVKCSDNTTMTVGGQTVANIVVNGIANNTLAGPYATSAGESTWFSKRPVYLQDLRGATPINSESVNMGARTINGSKFDKDVPTFTLGTNGVQDWTLKGARNHPFHLHIYHVQVQGNCGEYEDGEYYDVISGNCNIRFDLSAGTTAYNGRTIMHCHILEHEDQGAMGWADVIGGFGKPEWPTGFETVYSEYIGPTPPSTPNAPSGLVASTVSSSEISLSWTDNSNDEVTFDIERATSGGSFSLVGFTTANINTYNDTGLAANSTYDYRVAATNSADVSSPYSNTASAMTDPGGSATAVTIGSITVSTVGAGQGQKYGRAVVVAVDDQGSTVADALVSGFFSGTFADVVTDFPTSGDGSATIDTDPNNTVKGRVILEFCVEQITADGLETYNRQGNDPAACGSL